MIPAGFDYLQPTSINEALEMMSLYPHARFLAGGHALLPESKLRHTRPATLIDLGRIAELRGIEVVDDPKAPQERAGAPGTRRLVRIGAMTTSADIDWPPVVLAADATVHLRSRGGERAVSAREFFTRHGENPGAGSTATRPGELLTAVTVPAAETGTRSTYVKRMHPGSGHATPMANGAV